MKQVFSNNGRDLGLVLCLLCLLPPTLTLAATPVTSVKIAKGPISLTTRVQGSIESLYAPKIMSKVAAEVIKVLVDEGDSVKENDVLAELDAEGFRLDKIAAEADIRRLDVLLANQRKTLQRDESLTASKLVSEAILDEARAAVDQTQAQLAYAQSRLDKAEYQLSHCQILAPISGVVQQRSISKGDYVNPNSPNGSTLFQLVDTRHLRARLLFPETLSRQIGIGTQVRLIKNEPGNRLRLAASISQLRPMLEPGNRALHALVDFDNDLDLRPGESISAEVVLKRQDAALLVPEAALVQRPAGTVVYRLAGGKAEEVRVKTGIRQDGQVELTQVLAGHLAEGDELALDGASYLTQGAHVEIKATEAKTNLTNASTGN